MPSRFSTGGDYSQTFASLYYQNTTSLEAAAERVDAEREAVQASKDALVFTRWQEGKISGGELMAYINQRMAQTSYDKAQQNKWREAAITYGTQIADDRAEAAYAQSGKISALIGHYAGRLSDAKRGTPEYLELTQRLKTLTEQRDADSLRKQAKRIDRAIARGDMTTKDLIAFYQDQLKTLPANSPLREQVRDAVSELREKQRNDQFEIAMTKVDTALATGQISPAAAAAQKQAILSQYDIQARDPVNYWKWQQELRQLNATPDPAEIAKLEFDLAAGNITTEQYVAQIEEYADRIAPYDQQASWELLIEAQKIADDNALANPGALGLPSSGYRSSESGSLYSGTIEVVQKLKGNAIRFKTQLDGSAYSQYNCTMAAGAMLAYSMGARGLTGADLRYLSGVTTQGTNIQQLQGALERVGVDGTRLSWENRIAFEQFKQRLANGSTAVLSGWLGDIPAQLNTAGIATGHAMFAATYDPKRDAFLMLDPAKSNDPGTWWPSSIVQSFGWGGQRDGQALFSPPGTVDPKTLKLAGGKIQHISVTATPMRPGTPPGSNTQFDPGPQTAKKLQEATRARAEAEDRRLQRRLRDAGIEVGPKLDSREEVEAELDRRWDSYLSVDQIVDEWVNQYAENGEDVQDVVIGGTHQTLSRDDIASMQLELLHLMDGQELFYDALGDKQKMAEVRKTKAEIVTTGVGINSIDTQIGIGRLEREANAILGDVLKATDTGQVVRMLDDLGGIMEQLGAVQASAPSWSPQVGAEQAKAADQTEVERQAQTMQEGVTPEIEQQQAYYAAAFEIIRNPAMPHDQQVEALLELGDQFNVSYPTGWPDGTIKDFTGDFAGRLITGAFQQYYETFMLTADEYKDENGMPTGEALLINGQRVVLPTKPSQRTDPMTGEPLPDREPILEYLGEKVVKDLGARGFDGAKDLPFVIMTGPNGEPVHVRSIPAFIPYSGVEYLVWNDIPAADRDKMLQGMSPELRKAYDDNAGDPLDENTLEMPELNQFAIQDLRRRGVISVQPFMVERLLVPSDDGEMVSWYMDPGTGRWHQDNLPFVKRATGPGATTVLAHQYVGMELDEAGRPWPQLETDGDAMDPANLGVPAPYEAGLQPAKVGEYVMRLEQMGYNIDTLRVRNIDDPTVVDEYTKADPMYIDQWGQATMSIQDRIASIRKMRAEAMDKYATVAPAAQVAETAVMEDYEKRERARQLGIDYDTGKWLPGADPAMTKNAPSYPLLQELGIQVQAGYSPPTKDKTAAPFDPLSGTLTQAKSVAARNKAEQARKLAEASSQAKVGASTLPKIGDSTIMKPPASGVAANASSATRSSTTVPPASTKLGPPAPVVAAPVASAPQGRTTYLGGGR